MQASASKLRAIQFRLRHVLPVDGGLDERDAIPCLFSVILVAQCSSLDVHDLGNGAVGNNAIHLEDLVQRRGVARIAQDDWCSAVH